MRKKKVSCIKCLYFKFTKKGEYVRCTQGLILMGGTHFKDRLFKWATSVGTLIKREKKIQALHRNCSCFEDMTKRRKKKEVHNGTGERKDTLLQDR